MDERTSLSLLGHNDAVRKIKFLSNGILISASVDKTVKLWDVKEKKLIKTFRNEEPIESFDVADQKILVAGGRGQLTFWSLEKDHIIKKIDISKYSE